MTIGGFIAAVFQFIVVLTIMGPLIQASVPASTQTLYSGLLQTAISNSTNLQVQVSSAGAASASNATAGALQVVGGLAFLPAGFNILYKSIINIPTTVYIIFFSLGSSSPLLSYFAILVVSSTLLAYFTVLVVIKLVGSIVTKTSWEEI